MEDLIERARAIEIIHELQDSQTFDQTADMAYDLVDLAISEIPSAQPEPPTHGSIYAETAEKQGDRTTDGLISRHDAYNTLTEYYHHTTEIQHKALREALAHVPTAQPKSANELAEKVQNAPNDDFISRKAAIEIASGFCHPANVASELAKSPSAQPTLYGYNIEHLELIARVLQKEDLPPERVVEVLTDVGKIVAIVKDEFEEALRKAVEQCMT